MNGGDITFSTSIDSKNLEKNLEKDLNAVTRKIEQATSAKTKATEAKLPLEQQLDELTPKLDEAKMKLAELQEESEKIALGLQPDSTPEIFMDAYSRKDTNAAEVKAQQEEVEKLQKKWDGIVSKVESYDSKIAEAEEKIKQNTSEAEKLASQMLSASEDGANPLLGYSQAISNEMDKIGKRITAIAKRVFFFSLITKALSVARQYFGQLLAQNVEFQVELGHLKAALATAFQPLYEVAVPALTTILRILTTIIAVAANFISMIFGKTAKDSAKNAKALNDEAKAIKGVGGAAKEASKSLAAFDELNQLNGEDSGGGSGGVAGIGGADYSQFEDDDFEKKIADITRLVSKAFIAIGAFLLLTGLNIPLGIALLALGFLGLAKTAEGSDDVASELQDFINGLLIIVAGLEFLIGWILLATGNPLGLGLIVASLVTAGVALAPHWGALLDGLKSAWGDIKNWWNTEVVPGVKEMVDWVWEQIKALADWLNMGVDIGNWASTGGIGTIPRASVPGLANGAVIPPNAPFVAMLGDQRNGTNIEAPESLIRSIIRDEMGGGSRTDELLSTLIDVVQNIQVGDEVIGKAASRYNRAADRAYGR